MMDQYKEQYKKETEQIHAPADLIAKTKAAVREEEARIQREHVAQATESGMWKSYAARKKSNLGAETRKWVYPMTAVAAIFVLLSVSMMMRGLGKSGADTTAYESAAEADSGGEAFAMEEESDGAIPEAAAGGTMSDKEADFAEETADSSEVVSAEETTDSREMASPEKADDEKEVASAKASLDREMAAMEDETKGAVVLESVTIEQVWEKPSFVDYESTESRIYENTTFQVAKDADGWSAYVENENGDGYVIRGGMETIEAFLEAAYQKLLEIKS